MHQKVCTRLESIYSTVCLNERLSRSLFEEYSEVQNSWPLRVLQVDDSWLLTTRYHGVELLCVGNYPIRDSTVLQLPDNNVD